VPRSDGEEGLMAEIHGTCDERFTGVRDVLADNLDTGLDVGASVSVVLDGKPVVDVWGGVADAETGAPWERDTIINVWSTTKTMTFLCALMLADRGELDLYAPVARYWPEFAAGGKEGVEVRHLMAHTAGLSGWSPAITLTDLYDWEKATSVLAAQEPWWEPGTASGYHAVTQGFLIGEVVRRITGQSLGTFFAKEVAEPLGADFHIGLPAAHDARVARLVTPPDNLGDAAAEDSIAHRTFASAPFGAEVAWTTDWRRAEIPAANGHGNARSVARIQAVLACGGEIDGVRLLSAAGCERVFDEQIHGTDLVLGVPLRFGMGYGLNSEELPLSPNPRTCFWGGYGGSIIVIDLDARMTVCYVMNRMESGLVGDMRGASVVFAAYAGLAAG
jgi:CubicO group peptidase (beta-lactamase class C family)